MSDPTTTRRGFLALSTSFAAMLAACSAKSEDATTDATVVEGTVDNGASTGTREALSDDTNGGHAILVSGEEASYTAVDVTKTGDDEGDEADFYGTNAAVYAEDGATLNLEDVTVSCDGAHANAVFSYGEGTTINIANSVIDTVSNTSGGIMVTGGGALNASNLTIHTTGNSSAAIRSDRGGGTQVVDGGTYTTDGTGSPVIYSTADVSVSNAALESTASQGVVVEGKNSVALTNCDLVADNNTKNSDKSNWYQAVMIYQSMSGDAAQGEARFSIAGGSLANANGDVFFVNNTVATIEVSGCQIENADPEGNFLRAAAAGWGSEGNNGGHVTLNASGQEMAGDMVVDEISTLNLYLLDGSTFAGAINPQGAAGEVYVEVAEGSSWELTADANISSLTCDESGVILNGYTLTVGDVAYDEGTASYGEAVEVEVSETSGGPGGEPPEAPPDGNGGGEGGHGPGSGEGEPPEKPSGKGPGSDSGSEE